MTGRTDSLSDAFEAEQRSQSEARCENCRFWRQRLYSGVPACHRYPESIDCPDWHWCGEHEPKITEMGRTC